MFFGRNFVLLFGAFTLQAFSRGQIYAQAGPAATSEIVVTVTGIAYEDPALSLLNESLRSNKKVKTVKSSFDQQTATIHVSCAEPATSLWDEIPKTTRNFFRISAIDDGHISLQYQASSQPVAQATPAAKTDDDCRNCYFNLCRYDGTKSFQGVVFKQINYDDGTYYYNCDHGVLQRKIIYHNGYGQVTSITTDTVLMSNVPEGTKWGVRASDGSFLGMTSKNFSDYTLTRKGVSIDVDGKHYDDVIVVYYRQYSNTTLVGPQSTSTNYYYAKGVGLVKTENLGPISDPTYHPATVNSPAATANFEALAKTMPGSIDRTISGTWKYHDRDMNWDMFYVFHDDGTYQYFVGSLNPENQVPKGKCYWRVDGKDLVLLAESWTQIYRFELKKVNDAATHRPTLVIQFRGNEYRTYFPEESKPAW